jgi:hypothetical protein
MQKFQSVSIIDTLRKIVDNNTLFYKSDFEYDVETLQTAAPGSHFYWLSRKSGTELVSEREAHIRNAAAHNTWQYYSDTKYYSVKAFAVEVADNNGEQPLGNIYELNYNKHREEVRRNSFNAKSVDAAFNPKHWESEMTRTIDMAEYNDRWRSIVDRYGHPKSLWYNLSYDDETRLAEILARMRLRYISESEPASVSSYVRDMVRERFREYGYTQDDMVFTAPEDAKSALNHFIPVYILNSDNTSEKVKTPADIENALYEQRLFGMNEKDKRLLNFYKAGNTLDDLPFSRDELKTIFFMAIERGKENITDKEERQAIDSIIYVLDTALFSNDGNCFNETAHEQDNELDENAEQ